MILLVLSANDNIITYVHDAIDTFDDVADYELNFFVVRKPMLKKELNFWMLKKELNYFLKICLLMFAPYSRSVLDPLSMSTADWIYNRFKRGLDHFK